MYRVGLEINGSWGQAVIGPDVLATGIATFTNTATGKVAYDINSITGGYGQNTPLIDRTVVYRASTGNGFTYSFPDQVMSLVTLPQYDHCDGDGCASLPTRLTISGYVYRPSTKSPPSPSPRQWGRPISARLRP